MIELSSYHLPILTTVNLKPNAKQQRNKRTYTNYKKADWTKFTEHIETHLENNIT